MKLAFCIFKYFPYGGLQRDMYSATEIAIARGHEVDIYTMHWEGGFPEGATVKIVSVSGLTNHGRAMLFGSKLKKIFDENSYDRIVGFNKISGLDIYFTGENCFAQHLEDKAIPIMRYLPRYFTFCLLEKKLFSEKSNTEVLLISPREKKVYQKFYKTKNDRFHFLFPGVERRLFSDEEALGIKNTTREAHKISSSKIWILFVASDYALKGLGRVLEAIQNMDKSFSDKIVLSVVGHDDSSSYKAYLNKYSIKTRVDFLGASDNVYELMSSADLLVHPAKLELAGKVLLESMINHLPVLTTEVCGCADYIKEGRGGEVLHEPFSQVTFTNALRKMLKSGILGEYKKNLREYKMDERVYQSHEHLVNYIETLNTHYIRNFFIDEFLRKALPENKQECIRYIFSLEGKIYRQVKSRKTISAVIAGKSYFIKMHHGVGWREILKNVLVLKSAALGAKQEYKAIRAMEEAEILVPQVCAYATDGVNPAKICSFIVTKRIYYQYDLEKLCQTWPTQPPSFVFKRRLIRRVAEIARKMHEAGMNHRDFYLCHLLLASRSEADFDLYLIDLHRVQIRKKIPLRWRAKDLSGLYFSAIGIGLTRRDEYYFLAQYYQQPLKLIFKKQRLFLLWIYLRAKMLYRRHQNKH